MNPSHFSNSWAALMSKKREKERESNNKSSNAFLSLWQWKWTSVYLCCHNDVITWKWRTQSHDALVYLSSPVSLFENLHQSQEGHRSRPWELPFLFHLSRSRCLSTATFLSVHCTYSPFQPFSLNGSFLIRNKHTTSVSSQRHSLHVVLTCALWSPKQKANKRKRKEEETVWMFGGQVSLYCICLCLKWTLEGRIKSWAQESAKTHGESSCVMTFQLFLIYKR